MTTDNDWNLIYSYTRAQAIADGVLVDVTDAPGLSGSRSIPPSPSTSTTDTSNRQPG